jgi:hypothetical protein
MSEEIGIAVRLNEDFSVVRETLERIGIVNRKKKTFYPSCYCVETKDPGVYRIVHFKELFPLFERESTFAEVDKIRLKTIVHLLKNWNLVEVINTDDIDEILSEKITVLKHSEKKSYNIIHKFKFSTRVVLD